MTTGRPSLTAILLLALVSAGGCQPQPPSQQAPPPPAVTVSRPVARNVTEHREYTGRLDAVEMVEVRARVRGYLQKVNFKEGTEVKKGDPLYVIDPSEFQADVAKADADVKRLDAQLRLAESEAKRASELHGTSAISPEEYTQKIVARDTTQAQLQQAQATLRSAKLTLSYTEIRAPIAGRVSRTMVTEGNLVGYNEPTLLTTIVRMDPIYVYFDAPESDMLEYEELAREQGLARAADASVPVKVGVATDKGYPHQGVINFRDNRVDPGTGTILLRGVLKNPLLGKPPSTSRALAPGLFARVQVPFGKAQPRLLVPEVALSADQRGRFLLVVKSDDVVEYRPVTTGEPQGDLMVILTGLKPDDRVIVKGLQHARPGAKVAPVEVPPGMTSAPAPSPGNQAPG